MSQLDFVLAYFQNRPNEVIPHSKSKPEIEELWYAEFGTRMEDPDRAIRRLYEDGILQRVSKGVYQYSPGVDSPKEFSEYAKATVLASQDFVCANCATSQQEQDLFVTRRGIQGGFTPANGIGLCLEDLIVWQLTHNAEDRKQWSRRLLDVLLEDSDCEHWEEHARAVARAIASRPNHLSGARLT